MKKYLLPNKNAYKANLHTHSTFSDGNMSPEKIKDIYLRAGYSIVAYTDHEAIAPHNELRDENFLPITAYEVSINEDPNGGRFEHCKAYHLNLFSKDPEKTFSSAFSSSKMHWERGKAYLPEDKKGYECENKVHTVDSVNDIIAKAREEGFLVSYNHPVWSLHTYPDYIGLKGLFGVEVYNNECTRMGYRDTIAPWLDLLGEGEAVFPLATDDAHSEKSTAGGWLWVMADKLEYNEVMSALERGDFYASFGPEIKEISIDGNSLLVRTSPAIKVEIATERRARLCSRDILTPSCEFSFDLTGIIEEAKNARKEPFIRVSVYDSAGKTAWSRAYFINEI